MDIFFELSKDKSDKGLPIPTYLRLLVRRIVDAGFVQMIKSEGATWAAAFDYGGRQHSVALAPNLLVITDKGESLFNH